MARFTLILFTLLLIALTALQTAAADDIITDSKISNVTLYQDRAEVTRSSQVNIPAGIHTIQFRGVPQALEPDSLVAGGAGHGLTIQGVEFKNVPLRDDSSAKVQALNDRIEAVSADLDSFNRRKESLLRQREMLSSIKLDALMPENSETLVRLRTPKEISEILNLINEGDKKIDPELRSLDASIKKAHKDLEFLRAELAQLQLPQKSMGVIEMSVQAQNPGTAALTVSYQIHQAGWQPSYNLKVSEDRENQTFSLETFGVLQQQTGEDWDKVDLILSTARPSLGLYRPDPQPIVLDIFQPIAPQPASRRFKQEPAGEMAPQSQAAAGFTADNAAPQVAELESAVLGQAHMLQGAVIRYQVANKVSLKSDGSTQKILVANAALKGSIINVAVPALNSEVFREATLTNSSGSPLLPGALNIFSEGQFVGKSALAFTQPEQEIKLPVGVSQSIVVKRALMKQYKDDSGIVRSITRIRNDYQFEIENNSGREEKLVLLEPSPLSRNEKITVSLIDLSPEPLKIGDKNRIKDQDGITEWHLNLTPKSKQIVKLSSTIEHPADIQVSGLDLL